MRMLSVWISNVHGEHHVGNLMQLPYDRIEFVFDEGYLENKNAPILSQGYFDAYRNLLPTTRSSRLADPFFANLLPEGPLRGELARKNGVSDDRDFPLLEALGEDLPGAVVLRPAGTASEDLNLATSFRRLLEDGEPPLRLSLAGVQLKYSAIEAARGGLTIPVSGGTHIVKLPSAVYDAVPENEWSMMTFAQHLGFEVPPFRLVATSDITNLPRANMSQKILKRQSFLIERFDRTFEGRVHIEDFAQVFRIRPRDKYRNASYGSIVRVLDQLGIGVEEFVRRLVFNIGIGNADAHLKNWSLIYKDPLAPILAPVYDLVSTIQYIEEDKLALSLAGSKDWSDMSREQFVRFARRAELAPGFAS